MSNNTFKKPLAVALGAAFVTSLAGTSIANAAENPFGMTELSSGYMVVAEGKCGGSMDKSKMKKEGKCGGSKDKSKMKEGKCGEGKDKAKMKEGKCGEGKDKAKMKKEGKCGEGKCGGKK